MSDETKVEDELVITNDEITDPSTGETTSLADLAKSMKGKEKGMEVTSTYYEFPMGKEVNAIYVGDTTIKGNDNRDVPAVRLLLEDSSIVINASAVVVSTLRNYPKLKAFSIKRTGEHEGPNGKYYTYKIFELVG